MTGGARPTLRAVTRIEAIIIIIITTTTNNNIIINNSIINNSISSHLPNKPLTPHILPHMVHHPWSPLAILTLKPILRAIPLLPIPRILTPSNKATGILNTKVTPLIKEVILHNKAIRNNNNKAILINLPLPLPLLLLLPPPPHRHHSGVHPSQFMGMIHPNRILLHIVEDRIIDRPNEFFLSVLIEM